MMKDVRVGCALCQAAGQCVCYDGELWLDFDESAFVAFGVKQ